MGRAKDDPVTERFLEYFYAKCCENLFRPMVELPEHQKLTGERLLSLSQDFVIN
jgi:protein phosphatase 4 regulatory subunit 3